MPEHWRDIPDYEGVYQVSDFGRVRRLPGLIQSHNARTGCRRWKGRILRPGYAGRERCYAFVQLSLGGKVSHHYVHDLVMLAFVGPKPPGMEVCHGRNGKRDNRLVNLSYGMPTKNQGPDRRRDGTGNNVAVRRSDNKVFSSMTEAARVCGLQSHASISNVLAGRQQTAGGFSWELA